MTDFLWHKVSEKEKEEIQKQAKQIMKDFSKKLDGVKEQIKDFSIERDIFEREEKTDSPPELDREIMLNNAPNKNKDFIIAEKGKW